jgi:hypothetical protein
MPTVPCHPVPGADCYTYILAKNGGGSRRVRVDRNEDEPEILAGPGRSQPDLEDEETLLLHTETCLPVTVSQVRATWKRFLCWVDPELGAVTQMVLRASFATYIIHLYRTGRLSADSQSMHSSNAWLR